MGKGRSSAGGAARDDESKSPTKPFTDVHAIVFADFGLSVREPFTAEQLTRLHEAMAPTLLAAGFERDPADEEAEEGSVVYHRLTSGTGEIIEEFHIHANHVHLFVNEYRGWQVTKKIALDRLAPMWALVSDPTFGLANARLVLGYKDAFSNADPRSNSSHDVFKPNPLLPQYVFDAGLFWRYQLKAMRPSVSSCTRPISPTANSLLGTLMGIQRSNGRLGQSNGSLTIFTIETNRLWSNYLAQIWQNG